MNIFTSSLLLLLLLHLYESILLGNRDVRHEQTIELRVHRLMFILQDSQRSLGGTTGRQKSVDTVLLDMRGVVQVEYFQPSAPLDHLQHTLVVEFGEASAVQQFQVAALVDHLDHTLF